MGFICPHCQKGLKHKKSLNNHIAKLHPDKAAAPPPAPPPAPPAPPPSTKQPPAETLTIVKPPVPTSSYHCVDCGSPLDKGQNPCPGCGRELNWGAINEG